MDNRGERRSRGPGTEKGNRVNVLTIVSTFNRRDLTGVCLDAIAECRRLDGQTWVIDDGSTEFDHEWLTERGVAQVWEGPRRGVGAMARKRFEVALEAPLECDLVCMLDNDALVAPGFDRALVEAWEAAAAIDTKGAMLVTAYHSPFHSPVDRQLGYDVLPHVGGINLACTRLDAEILLRDLPEPAWDATWDWKLGSARLVRTARGFIQHMGRHGGGVNGASADRATDFVSWSDRDAIG